MAVENIPKTVAHMAEVSLLPEPLDKAVCNDESNVAVQNQPTTISHVEEASLLQNQNQETLLR